MPSLSLDDFIADQPTSLFIERAGVMPALGLIEGVSITPLEFRSDSRGSLIELLTSRGGIAEPIIHVYQVHATPGSIRAWIYHNYQDDRLAYTNGNFRPVLYDIRSGSRTFGTLEILDVGAARPCLVTIPRFVIHGLQNRGNETASFVNLPTNAYNPQHPDKLRLPANHPGIPYKF